jgi:CRISPR-associated protein Cmr4
MIENSEVVFFYTESAVHAGDGASTGSIDLPIQRDGQNGHPIFRYGTVKGALRDACRQRSMDTEVANTIFGPDTNNASEFGGAATFSDARILLFPIRSLAGVTAWITCPLALALFLRDTTRAGFPAPFTLPTAPAKGKAFVTQTSAVTLDNTGAGGVLFEEYHLTTVSKPEVVTIATWLAANALPAGAEYLYWRDRLKGENSCLAILSDEDFAYFVEHATNVVQRININHDTGTVSNTGLWTEESLPCDSLLYSVIHAKQTHRDKDAKLSDSVKDAKGVAKTLKESLQKQSGLIQLGGNETVGQGLIRLRFLASTPPAQTGTGGG